MFALAIVPAGVQGILLLFFPNSPRFLVMKGKTDKVCVCVLVNVCMYYNYMQCTYIYVTVCLPACLCVHTALVYVCIHLVLQGCHICACVTDIWQSCDRHVTGMWYTWDGHVIALWQAVVLFWHICDVHVTSMTCACDRQVQYVGLTWLNCELVKFADYTTQAGEVLRRLRGKQNITSELKEIRRDVQLSKVGVDECLSPFSPASSSPCGAALNYIKTTSKG